MNVHGTQDKNYLQIKCTILPLFITIITGVASEIPLSLFIQSKSTLSPPSRPQTSPDIFFLVIREFRLKNGVLLPFFTWNFCARRSAACAGCCPGSGGASATWDAPGRIRGRSGGAGPWRARGGWRTTASPATRFVKAVFPRSFRGLGPFCRLTCPPASRALGSFLL